MKKELKDYLKFYLGSNLMCQQMGEDGEFEMTGISWDDTQRIWWVYFENEESGYSVLEDVFPILRPLSDMTEEEALECWKLTGRIDSEKLEGWQVVDYYRKDTNFYEACEFYYLLSKHFDLFYLLESGLAISSNKIEKV